VSKNSAFPLVPLFKNCIPVSTHAAYINPKGAYGTALFCLFDCVVWSPRNFLQGQWRWWVGGGGL